MELKDSHKAVLRAYAMQCHPAGNIGKGEYADLCRWGLIRKDQDHITDRGLAHAVVDLGMSFSEFIERHKWRQRLSIFLTFAKSEFKTKEELDIYFYEKYKVLIKYDLFQPTQAEMMPSSLEEMQQVTGEMFLALAQNPRIDWQKLKRLFEKATMGMVELDFINSREDMIGAIKGWFRYQEATPK